VQPPGGPAQYRDGGRQPPPLLPSLPARWCRPRRRAPSPAPAATRRRQLPRRRQPTRPAAPAAPGAGVSARFGTTFFWNWAMWLLARLAPRSLLEDRAKVAWLASRTDPMVRRRCCWGLAAARAGRACRQPGRGARAALAASCCRGAGGQPGAPGASAAARRAGAVRGRHRRREGGHAGGDRL
jgi:hypothetical protein